MFIGSEELKIKLHVNCLISKWSVYACRPHYSVVFNIKCSIIGFVITNI